MIIIGLTGGIGAGKSTAAKILRGFGLPVHDADAAVHALLKKGGTAVKPIGKIFPDVVERGAVNRKLLGQAVFGKPRELKRLEKILHPLVREAETKFLARAKRAKKKAAVLDIPLLFETGGNKRCDITICVTAPIAIRRARVMQRPHMTPAKFKAIVAHQMPDAEKKKRADYIVPTGKGLADTRRRLGAIVKELKI